MLVVCGAFFCMREIEISLALREHVCVDEEARQVSCNLPCSKTNPKSLGIVRAWECVCGGTLVKPCAFHAFDAHLKHLRARFGGSPLWEDLSLFPTSSGGTADTAQVVKLIESLAATLRLPTVTLEGRNIFGCHSLRVTGAQWLVRMGIPLAIIQLLARWSSVVVARYVAEVPLSSISELYRQAGCSRDLEEVLSAARVSAAAATEWQQVFGRRSRVSCSRPRLRSRLVRPGVLCRGKGKTHVVANRALKMLPAFEWKAACGWKLGLAECSFSPVPGQLSGRCNGCFRVCGVEAADGSSSSGWKAILVVTASQPAFTPQSR